jgi:hypothetical protein
MDAAERFRLQLTPGRNNYKKDEPQHYENKIDVGENIHLHFLLVIIIV